METQGTVGIITNESNEMTRQSLAPHILKKDDPAHYSVDELSYAISLPECKNIAVTGVYGSGKSSIIDTYMAEEGNSKKVLRISLSNFGNNEEISNENSYENEIEFKLFQHIIYKANYDKTRGSRYKRLPIIDYVDVRKLLNYITALIVCFIIVFEPKVFRIDSFYRAYYYVFGSYSAIINVISDIIASVVMVIVLYNLISDFMYKYRHLSIESFKTKDIEINFEKEKSVFNKLLDEIVYYFKAGEYELIIFEDLDRIKNPRKLFLKLREINILLNESDYYISKDRRIKFIYAIKDDIFQGDDRTKCFDYIIPVIPIVNSHNAGEFLLQYYKTEIRDINVADVKRLGAYIVSMRELTNMMNEYILYRKTILKDGMSSKKLLAITIYKNLFPHDYSLVHSKDGCLFKAFDNKKVFINPQIKDLEEEKDRCIETIKNARKAITQNRYKFLDVLYNKHSITDLIINGVVYSLNEIAQSDSLFNSFKNDKVERWIVDAGADSETGLYNYKFKDVLAEVDPDNLFIEAIDDHEREIGRKTERKRFLEKQIYNIERKSLSQLMKMNGDGKKAKELLIESLNGVEVKDEQKPYNIIDVLNTMIYSGYISDDYTTYISYTHKGSFDEQDFKYLQSINQGMSLEYNYKLNHIDSIIDLISSDSYENKCILNNDLLIYLLKGQRAASLDSFILTARNNLDFVMQFESTEGDNEKFLKQLFNGWQGCIKIISEIRDNDIRTYMLHQLFRVAPLGFQLSTDEKEFVSTQYKFISEDVENCSISNLNAFFSNNGIIFKELVEPNGVTQPLYDSIIKQNRYEINYNNLKIIYGDVFDTKSYTSILKGDSALSNYILRDINFVIGLFPNTDTEESVDAIINLARNKNVRDDVFTLFLSRQNAIIPDLSNIPLERISLFFKYDKVKATWKNIQQFFAAEDDVTGITPFIIKHVSDLAGTPIDESDDKFLQLLLMDDNSTLPLEIYKALLPSCGYPFNAEEIDKLNEERLSIILDKGFVEYNENTKELYSSKNAKLFGDFLIHFFDAFMADESFDIKIPNNTSIYILNSSMTLEQKKYFIDNRIILYKEEGVEELSKLICSYYLQMPIDEDTNVSVLINAMDLSGGNTTWKQRIDLVNRINDNIPYDNTIEKALLNSLGGGYLSLNKYRGVSYFDDNEENRKLIYYLKAKGHYVNNVIEGYGRIKVTFKNPPTDEKETK